MIKVIDVASELGLYLKVVVSTKSFDNYNAFFNIYDEDEEPCRRIVILTKDELIEEVNDKDPGEEITEGMIIDGNVWVREYPLIINPKDINLEEIEISKELYEKIKEVIS